MRLNKIKNIIKEQILLLEKEKWFTSMKASLENGVLSKPEGDPFNPEPQMMARGEEKLCPCGPGGDMIPCSECPKKSIREEMVDDLKDQVIIPNKIKPKSGGCGCGKKR